MADRRHDGLTSRERTAAWWLLVGYGVVLAVGLSTADESDPGWRGWGFAVATIALALGAIGIILRAGRRSKELERFVFSESASLAFFATMLTALTYGLLETLVNAPRLSAWATWSFGMGVWAVLRIAMDRSLR